MIFYYAVPAALESVSFCKYAGEWHFVDVAQDIITYNTLLKGYCSKNDIKGAKDSQPHERGRERELFACLCA